MRKHTLNAHELPITKYKEEYGSFELLQVGFWRFFCTLEMCNIIRMYGTPVTFEMYNIIRRFGTPVTFVEILCS